jgi:hypothetical protein
MLPEKKSDTVRTVKRGDTLYRMVQDVYGSSDYGLIVIVQPPLPLIPSHEGRGDFLIAMGLIPRPLGRI